MVKPEFSALVTLLPSQEFSITELAKSFALLFTAEYSVLSRNCAKVNCIASISTS